MSEAAFTKEEILEQLDSCAKEYTFPILDNGYVYLGDVRLSCYSDVTRWALIIEVISFNPRAGGHAGVDNCLYCFGNCLKRKPGIANEDFLFVTADSLDVPTFDAEYGFFVRTEAHSLQIRDVTVPINLSPDFLATKGILIENDEGASGAELLRSLLPEHRDLLLATEEELRGRVPLDLPCILRLDEWHHPDLAGDDLPSASPTFQMIADVFVTTDAARYRPELPPNTHWKHWPESGTL